MPHSRIAIVGAGPGGLTLARILHVHGLQATVFEREASSEDRPQGRSLDMHEESGLFAIEQAGLSAEFARIARHEDQEVRIYDKHGALRFHESGEAGDRPEVDRAQLRQMLLDSLPAGVIRWGHELSAAEVQDDGTVELAFRIDRNDARNGARERFDLLVGADGAWSRVRPLVSEVRPVYSGVTMVEMGIADADAREPEIARLVGRGMAFALGDSKALMGHRDANAHVGIYAGLRVTEDWIANGGLDTSSSETLRSSLAVQFGDWSPKLLQLLFRSDDRITPRAIHALPIGHCWEHRKSVTLLGDAAHLMSPFSGEGANLAMWDAADLALALAKEDDWDAAVRGFEEVMFARAEKAAVGAKEGIDGTFSEEGLDFMLRQMAGHSGEAH